MPTRVEAIVLALMFMLGAIVFSLWPQIDLRITSSFYVPGRRFPWGETWPAEAVYWFVWYGSRAAVGSVLLLWLTSLFVRRGWLATRRRWFGFLALSFALGPGLIADQLLKNHWGRARPEQIVQFGGEKQFSPALQPSDQCARNCSFVSGHATGAFALMAFGWFAASPRRRNWLLAATVAGLFVGAGRVVQGGHFASDVFFAFYAVWLGNLLAWLILRATGKLPSAIPPRLA